MQAVGTDAEHEQMLVQERNFFTLSMDLLCITSVDGYFKHLNPAFERILGYRKEELLEKAFLDFVHPEDQAITSTKIEKFAKSKSRIEFEHRYRCQDGAYKWLKWQAHPAPTKNLVYAIARDITEQKHFEKLLEEKANLAVLDIDISIERQQNEQKIYQQAALLDIATNAILVRGLDHQILYWNKGAERLYGWTNEEVLGKNACQILFNEFSIQLEEAKKTVFEQEEWHGEFQQVTKNGNKVFVESHWTLVRDTNGKPTSILVVNTNITEKKQLENQFLRDQRMESIGTLASGIAHDLNNILTPILISIQLLESKVTDQQSQHLLATLETNTKRGSNLVKQLLSFARGIEPDRTVIQIENLVTEIKQIAREAFPKSIDFKVDIPRDIWTLPGDPTQIHQVLMNLCVNAHDAMLNGGNLCISARNVWLDQNYVQMNSEAKVGPYVEMTVTDSGVGIPAALLDKIFEPFFTTKELGKGTGLGLSTVVGIVKNHGGFVKVSSNVGKGTQFRIYLPAINLDEIQQKEELELQLHRGQGELILVVDDEATILEVTKLSLEASGYQVITANDGIDAISTYVQNKQEISVVIIDMMMPSMDGLITSKTLKRINSNIKIIATSGINRNTNILVDKYGINRFLLKPFTSKELLATISSVIHNKCIN